ncbi:Ig-like domain-containing protein [Paenibacillus segetis]|uniref:BIG2 domain-containing protein n=1 Tax=Paenibacillus segetis TaxID=1325360 RepID=A0ABQ1YIU6_9BACL|nr:Ig-like domain-containing protein [Paenibacillus segetis]GGH26090.1 hypothetical protein GCM10008013_26730 [Paenibacillus segetis]
MIANRKMMKWLLALTLLLAAVFPTSVLAATGDVRSIDIEGSGSVLELNVGKSKQLKVWGTLEGSTSKSDLTGAVDWTSTDDGIVKVTNGFLTAIKSGTVTIKAMYNNSSVSTIEVKAVDTYKELSLDYGSEGKYKLGDTNLWVYANATIDTSEAKKTDVTDKAEWSTSNASVLTIEKGKITLVGEGTATITAKYAGLTATFKATVSSPYSELKINRVNEGSGTPVVGDIELLVGDDAITLQAIPVLAADKTKSADDVSKETKWTSSDSSVATVEEGKVKALSTGKTTITAEYLGAKATVDVYVRAAHEAIIMTPSTKQVMFIGEKLQVTAGVRDSANHTEDVTTSAEWTSANPLLFTVSKGEVIAKAAGTSSLKTSYKGVSKSINITVYPTITKLATEKTELELLKGESLSVPKVTATKLDDEELDFSKEVEWSSANDEIAIVEDGKIIAKGAGEVILTAKLPESAVSSASELPIRDTEITIKLTVKEKVLALLTDVDNVNVVIGEETALPDITVVWEDGSEAANYTNEMKWTLSGSNAVLKDSASGKVIKGLLKGSATLKGTYSNKVISIPVVIEPKITKIVVEPQNIELNLKKSKAIKVTGYYTNGKTVNLGSKVNWESSNVEVASITSTTVKAVAEGTATLNGSYQGIKVSVKVSVVPKLKTLTVDEKKLVLAPGGVKTVVVTALYDTGKTSAVTGSAVWTSSKPSVAKVTNGKIEAIAKGTTTIKGKFDGKTVSITVKVN